MPSYVFHVRESGSTFNSSVALFLQISDELEKNLFPMRGVAFVKATDESRDILSIVKER